jgi:hypothetical protein
MLPVISYHEERMSFNCAVVSLVEVSQPQAHEMVVFLDWCHLYCSEDWRNMHSWELTRHRSSPFSLSQENRFTQVFQQERLTPTIQKTLVAYNLANEN